jgi:hypothetical protein
MSNLPTYRLSPPDRTGVFLGASAGQLAIGSFGMLLGTMSLTHYKPVRALIAYSVTIFLVFGRRKGQTVMSLLPTILPSLGTRLRRRQQWFSVLPLVAEGEKRPIDLPPPMVGQRILSVEGRRFDYGLIPAIAVVHDEHMGRVSATLRASGRRFGFLEPAERCDAVDAWGQVLTAWGRETTCVDSVRVTEWSAPAGMERHKAWMRSHLASDAVPGVVDSYEELISSAAAMVTPHETYLTLTINIRSAVKFQGTKKDTGSKDAKLELGVRVLCDELRVLRQRLEAAGLSVSAPLSPGELGRHLRHRFDAWSTAALDIRAQSLGEQLGTTLPEMAGPLATDTQWRMWRTDSSLHRAFCVTEWPRHHLQADWFGHVLLGGRRELVRAVTTIFEPIPPSRSRKAITYTDTKLETDEVHRRERKLRVPAALQRQKEAVRQREHELDDGHREFAYGSIIVVSGETETELEEACRDMVEVCANAGMTIRPLDGRHDSAMVATLPLARSVAPRAMFKDVIG